MGQLVDGQWHKGWYDTEKTKGRYQRFESTFRHWITPDGEAGFTGESGFRAEPGRYHLYIGLSCPFAQRTWLYHKFKGLENVITVSIARWSQAIEGWAFDRERELSTDPVNGASYLYEIYTSVEPNYCGRATAPILWDKEKQTIVNNESLEINRMLNSAFNEVGARGPDFYPLALREDIDALNQRIYTTVNNGVYRAGFATTQEAYDEAVIPLFQTLDFLEERLSRLRYLLGDRLTEADWNLFPSLVRFDVAYYNIFKCNLRRLVDYPNLWAYTRELFQMSGVAETICMDAYKRGYYSIEKINPSGIVPVGPEIDFAEPHGREELSRSLLEN